MPEYKFTHIIERYEEHVVEAPTLEQAWKSHFDNYDDWDFRSIDCVEKDGAFMCSGEEIENAIYDELEWLDE